MSKHYLLSLVLCAFSVIAFGQSITSISPPVSHRGSSINVDITGTSTNFSGATQSRLVRGGSHLVSNAITIHDPFHITANFTIPPSATLGNYDVLVGSRFGNAPLTGGFSVTATAGAGSFGYLRGNIFEDVNLNCTHDVGEPGLQNWVVELLPGPVYLQTDANGDYATWLNLGSYTVNISPPIAFQGTCNPSNSVTVNLVNANDTVTAPDFAMENIGIRDLSVLLNSSGSRPGFHHTWFMPVTNNGSTPMGGTLKFLGDTLLPLLSTTHPYTLSGDTLIFNIPPINPGQRILFKVEDSVPPTTAIGTIIGASCWVIPTFPDQVPGNNVRVVTHDVTGSYDPNDKQSFGENGHAFLGYIQPGDSTIDYLIRFQNTGNDTAFNIFIRDTLDPQLNILSFQTTGSSHSVDTRMSANGAVEWYFANILLLDSTRNEPASHGFVSFSIKFDAALPIGTFFENTAHIYFDFNAPIVTNTTSDTIGCAPLRASFTDSIHHLTVAFSSLEVAQSYFWDFGDGTTSNSINPTHTYAGIGIYSACLIVTNNCGQSDTICRNIDLCTATPAGNFGVNSFGLTASFSDSTTFAPSFWQWDFGDGNTSTQQNPQHAYAASGTYTVCLISGNTCGSDTVCTTLVLTCTPAVAQFGDSISGVNVQFTDQSTASHATSWHWDFGDGTTSTAQNPTHSYGSPGTYTVCMTIQTACGNDSICQVVNISCTPIQAGFTHIGGPGSAQFNNTTSGVTTSWLWDFGDGNTSTQQNPNHLYSSPGTYIVCLIATGPCVPDTVCKSVQIFCNPVVASFTPSTSLLTAFFTNSSSNASNFFWDFGDGNASTSGAPSHTYSVPGTYTVCLVSSSACSTDSICQTITVSCQFPVANYSTSRNGNTVLFFDQTANGALSWHWDFGDGTTSNVQNPLHTFGSTGPYNVCMIATNACGADTTCQLIDLLTALPEPDAEMHLSVYPVPASDFVHITGENAPQGDFLVRLYDLTGQLQQVQTHRTQGNSLSVRCDLAKLPAGIYFVELAWEDQQKRLKIIKQ